METSSHLSQSLLKWSWEFYDLFFGQWNVKHKSLPNTGLKSKLAVLRSSLSLSQNFTVMSSTVHSCIRERVQGFDTIFRLREEHSRVRLHIHLLGTYIENILFPYFKLLRYWDFIITTYNLSSLESLSSLGLFATPWTAARQASLSITNTRSLLKLMSIKWVMPFNHLFLCHPLLLLPSIFPSIRVFSNESALCIRWPKYWSFI